MSRLARAAAAVAFVLPLLVAPSPHAAAAPADTPLTTVDQVGLFQVHRDAADGDRPTLSVLAHDYDGGNDRNVDARKALLHLPSASRTTVPRDDYARDADGNPTDDQKYSFYRFLGPVGTPLYTTAFDPAAARAAGTLALGYAGSPDVYDGAHYSRLRLQDTDGPGAAYDYLDYLTDPGRDPDTAPYRELYWDLSRPRGVENLLSPVFGADEQAFTFAAFTAPGDYCLQVRPEIAASSGAGVENGDPVAIRVVVGDRTDAELDATPPCEQPDATEPTDPTDPDAPVVLGANTHVDVAGVLRNGQPLSLVLRKTDAAGGGNERILPFADTVVSLPDYGRTTVPSDAEAGGDTSFLGRPGDPTWRIPEQQDRNLVWFGFGGELITDRVSSSPILRLTGVTGADGGAPPGEVTVWSSADFSRGGGPTFSTRQGTPQAAYLPVASHGHRNWDFSAPGVYCLGMDLQLADAAGSQQRAAQQLTVVVGDTIDPATVQPCGRSGRALPIGVPARSPAAAPANQVLHQTGTGDGAVPLTRNRLSVGLTGTGALRTRLVHMAPDGPGTAYDPKNVVLRAQQDPDPNSTPTAGAVGRRLYSFPTGTNDGGGATLEFDSLGVESAQLSGPLSWQVTGVRGPGTVTVDNGYPARRILTASQAAPRASTTLIPGRAEKRFQLHMDKPGVYCLDLAWSGTRAGDRAPVRTTTTVTLVAGTSPATVTTCTRGQRPTPPAGSSAPPGSSPPPASGRPNSGRTVLRTGHVDVRSDVTASALKVRVHDDGHEPAVDRDPAAVTLYAAPGARSTVPANSSYAFLGKAGSPVWVLPQTQNDRLLWPGWNVTLGGGARQVRWTLDSVRGPGRFALFENGAFGTPRVLLNSTRRGSHFDFDAHGHGNWAFGADGVYCLHSTFTAAPTGRSATTTVLVAVGNLNPSTVTPKDCGRTAAQVRALDAAAGNNGSGGSQSPSAPGNRSGRSPITGDGALPIAGSRRSPDRTCIATSTVSRRRTPVSVVSQGHFDLGSRLSGTALHARVEDGRSEPAIARDASGLVFDVGTRARHTVPAGYGFLGRVGSPVWIIPQTQQAGVPWLGWNTQDPSLRSGARGRVTFTLSHLSGPGALAVYTDGAFGGVEQRVFGTATGFARSFTVPLNVHAHANWAFTAPGTYRVVMTQSATLRSGGTRSATATLTFAVGQADPAASAPRGSTVEVTGRTASGEPCRLSADQRARALASTGADLSDAISTGLLLLGAGLALLLVRRRRRRAP